TWVKKALGLRPRASQVAEVHRSPSDARRSAACGRSALAWSQVRLQAGRAGMAIGRIRIFGTSPRHGLSSPMAAAFLVLLANSAYLAAFANPSLFYFAHVALHLL